ncbi:helix-turn-helix domain-containing protein [Paenibacillus sp. TAB 01]|uniref:helix-turn-helix domain-containing protein n=1 Tax=Paenibacillus sp. TAB 01 TaxID=3368988 RepID=UPI0037530848
MLSDNRSVTNAPNETPTQKKGRFFRRSLIMVIIIASLPGLFIGIGIYFVGSEQIANETNRLHQQQVEQAQKSIDDQLYGLETSLSHWAFDPQFDDKLKKLDFVYGYSQVQDIFKTLLVMKQLNPLIDKVTLYLRDPYPLLFTEEGYHPLASELQPKFDALIKQPYQAMWSNFTGDEAEQTAEGQASMSTLSLIHKIPGGSPRPFGVFLVTVNAAKLKEAVTILTPHNEGTSFLIQGSGQWIAPFGQEGAGHELDEALRKHVLEDGGNQEHFMFSWGKEKYSVSSVTLNRLGTDWIYVSATPLTALTGPVVFISRAIIGFSCFGILLAVVLSWFASRRLYKPVERLVQLLGGRNDSSRLEAGDEFEMIETVWNRVTRESQTLQTRLESQLPQVRQGFLLQLSQGYLYYLSEADLQEQMANLGWDVARPSFYRDLYAAARLCQPGGTLLRRRRGAGDVRRGQHRSGAGVRRLRAGGCDQLPEPDDRPLDRHARLGAAGADRERIHALLQDMTDRLNLLLHLRVAVGLGQPVAQIKEIPAMMEETRQVLRFRDLQEHNQILDLGEWVTEGEKSSEYPFHLEKEVLHGLRMGQEDETTAALSRFLHELRMNAGKELWVQQGMLHLLASVQRAIMQMGTSLSGLYEGVNLYDQLCQIKEPEEIEKWFLARVIYPFLRETRRKQDIYLQQAVDRIVTVIHEKYMEELSLESIAEAEHLSSYALSRMFKQHVGINFIDYLTEIRLEKAKELLCSTDLKLNEVAERVGYQHSYFSRIFKKNVGMTPSKYRDNAKE